MAWNRQAKKIENVVSVFCNKWLEFTNYIIARLHNTKVGRPNDWLKPNFIRLGLRASYFIQVFKQMCLCHLTHH